MPANLPAHMLCHGVTGHASKNPGTPCPNRIYEAESDTLCYAHWQATIPRGDPARVFANGDSPGRPRIDRPSEVLLRRVEARVDEVVDVLFDALGAADQIVVKIDKDTQELVESPNHSIRMKAAETLLDRALGKPTQNTRSLNVNVGIEARTEDELATLAEAMRAARMIE